MIAALLLVALMATVAVQLTDLARFAAARTVNSETRAQAYWYARGAREFAESVLAGSGDRDRPVMRPTEPWLAGPQVFPIEGGMLEGRIRDGNNCFNINALSGESSADADPATALADRNRAFAMFRALVRETGLAPGAADQLAAEIKDWADPDGDPEPAGAEDAVYARYDPPYRAANRPFVELEELRALPSMSPALYAALQPWLCVRPEPRQQPINVNTLTIDQAPLLSALFEGRLSRGDAEAVLFRRPPDGYDALDQFFTDTVISRITFDWTRESGVALRSRWFEMEVRVTLGDTGFTLSQLAELESSGQLTRRYERFGAF